MIRSWLKEWCTHGIGDREYLAALGIGEHMAWHSDQAPDSKTGVGG
jgi:hypothetical protein